MHRDQKQRSPVIKLGLLNPKKKKKKDHQCAQIRVFLVTPTGDEGQGSGPHTKNPAPVKP